MLLPDGSRPIGALPILRPRRLHTQAVCSYDKILLPLISHLLFKAVLSLKMLILFHSNLPKISGNTGKSMSEDTFSLDVYFLIDKLDLIRS